MVSLKLSNFEILNQEQSETKKPTKQNTLKPIRFETEKPTAKKPRNQNTKSHGSFNTKTSRIHLSYQIIMTLICYKAIRLLGYEAIRLSGYSATGPLRSGAGVGVGILRGTIVF